ncbi:protein DBF4 homolog A isoform X1 [Salarias fasciatus]|nr:protein DBF4 homolog A isoform X1 [Salarias fasciatus]
MKPKRTQRQAGAQWHEKAVNTGDKTTLNPAKQKSHLSSSTRIKPFAGKVFYLDLPSNRVAETLERDIKELGGTVEKFFSKEIRYLVSNKREARYVHCLKHDSPVPSPESGPSSPHPRSVQHHPGCHGENNKSKNQGQTETFVTSRGKSLVERVVKEQERVQINKILSNALEWGVKILYIDDVIAYVHKKKKTIDSQVPVTAPGKANVKAESALRQRLQKHKVGKIRKPFIKVEDSSRHYRPIYLTLESMPEFSLETVAPGVSLGLEGKDPPGSKRRGPGTVKATANEVKGQVRKKSKDKKRSGFCECCMVRFDSLTVHLKSEHHKAFSKSTKYSVVDRLVSTLSYNFIPINTKTKRPKCSVSSVIKPPGPCQEAQTVEEETLRGADGRTASYLESILKMESPSDSFPPSQQHKDRRNHYTYSHSSKQKYLACRRPFRQNSLDADKEQVAQPTAERAPSADDVFSTLPSRVCHVDPQDQKPEEHVNGSTSHVPDVSSTGICVAGSDRDAQLNADTMPADAIHDKNLFPDRGTELKLPHKEEDSIPAERSPVQEVKRKIRVYKHKRRKVDTQAECVESILKLWECFQSSDDMDVEFHGFKEEEL